ncbi:hypothetical protein HMPREF9999_01263 [Alloprevotella sp. oral taxon 473 str. F0040]|nr:hypothetical protein HMPREF9999_01263 [Alloprevotella sp. oral taxon 473 str. F0040]
MNKTIEEATSSQCPVQDRKSLIIWGYNFGRIKVQLRLKIGLINRNY